MSLSEFVAERRARFISVLRELRSDVSAWPVAAMTALCLVMGFWLRARGFFYDVPAMWTDECSWMMFLEELPLSELMIRPPGFMLVSKGMMALFGPTETPLRTLPWLASVATMAMSPFLARWLFRAPAARLLFVAIVCLHPVASDFAKEFKPYSVSLFLHMSLMLLALRFVESKRARDLAWLLVVASFGTLFAQDLVFSLPGVFLIAGFEALKHDRKKLVPIGLAAGFILALLLAQYLFIWRNLAKDESQFWAERYNVFFSEESGKTFFSWFTSRYEQVAAFPGFQRMFWKGIIPQDERLNARSMGHYVWLFLHFAGIVSMLWRKRFREATLLLLPLVVLIAFNLADFWPFGAFRTNLFLVGNTAAIAAMAFDETIPRRAPIGATIPAAVLIVAPLLFFEDGLPPTKRAMTFVSEFPTIVEYLAKNAKEPPAPRQHLILGRGTCYSWKYYLRYYPKTRHLRAKLESGFDAQCLMTKEELDPTLDRLTTSSTTPTWLVRGIKEPQGKNPDIERIERFDFGLHEVSAYIRPPSSPVEVEAPKRARGERRKRRPKTESDDETKE